MESQERSPTVRGLGSGATSRVAVTTDAEDMPARPREQGRTGVLTIFGISTHQEAAQISVGSRRQKWAVACLHGANQARQRMNYNHSLKLMTHKSRPGKKRDRDEHARPQSASTISCRGGCSVGDYSLSCTCARGSYLRPCEGLMRETPGQRKGGGGSAGPAPTTRCRNLWS